VGACKTRNTFSRGLLVLTLPISFTKLGHKIRRKCESGSRWEDVVVDNSKVIFRHLIRGNEGNKSKPVSAFLALNFATRNQKSYFLYHNYI
jgi:hypothetical protein